MSLMFDPNMVRPKPVSKDREIVLGSITIIAGLLGFFLWAVFSPLHEGVVATGSVVVESHRKIVQHLEGGLVKAVLVKEGSVVKKDDILVEMEGTQARANLDIVTGRYWSALALLTRLEAIYNNQLSLVFPPDLLAAAKGNEKLTATLNAQREIFRIYQEQYANQYRIYQERVAALTDQQRAKQTYLGNMKQELGNLETLEKDRLIDQSSLIARQRDYQETKSDVNRLGSEIAASRLSLTQLKIDTMDKASRDMAEARKELNDLKLQKDNLQDVVDRTQVRSPADGTVLRLAISSSGQVVPPGGALMEIVPLDDRLVIDAMVSAADRSGLVVGQKARVTFPSIRSNIIPNIYGDLERISADIIQNPNPSPATNIAANKINPSSFYTATVSVSPAELAKLGNQKIEPGMPAQVMLEGARRTPIKYFLKPFSGLWERSFIEK